MFPANAHLTDASLSFGNTRARLWRSLRAKADGGAGVLVTTHYMQEAAQCDRLVILTAGVVTAEGTVADITGAQTSLTVMTDHWQEGFGLLRLQGIAALLDGCELRVPGADQDQVLRALASLSGEFTVIEGAATLEETMMLATLSLP